MVPLPKVVAATSSAPVPLKTLDVGDCFQVSDVVFQRISNTNTTSARLDCSNFHTGKVFSYKGDKLVQRVKVQITATFI